MELALDLVQRKNGLAQSPSNDAVAGDKKREWKAAAGHSSDFLTPSRLRQWNSDLTR